MANIQGSMKIALSIIVISLIMSSVIQMVHSFVVASIDANDRNDDSFLAPVWSTLGANSTTPDEHGLAPISIYIVVIGAFVSLIFVGISLFGKGGSKSGYRRSYRR
ncbi:MAG TPA: hypothetical protein PK993_03905 [Clostridia bacterium]|nr:hypothetical protein [Clostridia bacterium]